MGTTSSFPIPIDNLSISTFIADFLILFLFSFHIPNSTDLFLLSPPVEPLFYIYLFYQNHLIHMPFFYFLHSLVHSLLNLIFNKHSLKAIPLFPIKHFQVGYVSLSLDLNIL